MQETAAEPIALSIGLRKQACEAIKRAITEMDIYGHPLEIRLDERQLSQDLGVSRTPIREALSVLEQEGFVRSVPRRGMIVVRKTKREIVEMITVWAAIESMAARHRRDHGVTEAEIAELHALVDVFQEDPSEHLSEYSDANMAFHKAIIRMGGVDLMTSLTDTLFIHMRAVRAVTMTQDNRAQRSIVDHRAIIAALEQRDADLAERLVREHTLGLAAHVEQHGDFLDRIAGARTTNGAGNTHRREVTMSAALEQSVGETEAELTDGFHLVIDALKLNGIKTIYGVPGIPITDLGRLAQAEGMRVISFRHEQNAGNAAAIAGFLTKSPGVCLTVSAPGFLNGLVALANATTNCFPMILISGSSEREIVDLQQGDYEEMDQLAIAKPLCKAAFRVLHAADIGIGVARAIRAAVSGRPGGVYLDLPGKLFSQVMEAEAGRRSLVKVIDPAPAQISGTRTLSSARSTCCAAPSVR